VKQPDPESIRLAMEIAWRDHHHMREQTWRVLQIEAVLAAGLIGVDWQIQNIYATVAAGLLVIIAAIFGVLITLHHRKAERRKFTFINNCEEALLLHGPNLLPEESCQIPSELHFMDAFNFRVQNTAAFILRMNIAIMFFAVLYIIGRIFVGYLSKGIL
jgi:hypothetical protein